MIKKLREGNTYRDYELVAKINEVIEVVNVLLECNKATSETFDKLIPIVSDMVDIVKKW